MTREEKLAKLKENQAAKNMVIISDGEPFIQALEAKIGQLKDALGVGVDINNLDELIEELAAINTLKPIVADLKLAIDAIEIPNIPDTIEVKGLDSLLKVCKDISSRKDVTVEQIDTKAFDTIATDISKLVKAIDKIQVPKQGQEPGDFVPTRRVMKVGEKLMFDDSFHTGGGGGGSGVAQYVDANNVTQNAGTNYPLPTTIYYQGNQAVVANGSLATSNVVNTFRSGFASSGTQPDPAEWTLVNNTNGVASTDHLITQGGNSSGSSYLRISLSPFVDSSEVNMTSVPSFNIPIWPRFGISTSQRIVGQEVFAGLVGIDSSGTVDTVSTPADIAITGATISITSNVGTVTLTNHGLNGADRINIYGCAEPRLNVGPVVVTPVDVNTFTVPITLANGTYSTTGGYVRYVDPLAITSSGQGTTGTAALNGGGFLLENTTVTNASFVARRNGSKFRSLNSTIASTTASQTNTAPFTDAFNTASNNELLLTSAEFGYRSFASDGVATMSGLNKFTQGLPDESKSYKIRIRARNLKGMTMPVARITAIAKTGTTTATVTTDVAHGLTTSSQVQIYGVLDQTNFPNLTAQTAVASVIDSTNFTVVIGTASTTSSSGGTVFNVQGSILAPGVFAQAVQSVSCTSNVMTFIGSGTWATPLPGEYIQIWGMTGSAAQYDGAYKVLRVSTTTLDVAAPGVADFGSISTGGAAIRRTDVRIHFVQVLDYNPLIIEGGRGNSTDINNSVPTSITGGTLNALTTVTTVTTVTNQSQMSGFVIKDTLLNSQDRSAWGTTIRGRIT